MGCAPKVCIAVINREKSSVAGECARTSAQFGAQLKYAIGPLAIDANEYVEDLEFLRRYSVPYINFAELSRGTGRVAPG